MSNPWYAFYPGDYARDTAHLSMLEHGAYRLLLDHAYSNATSKAQAMPKHLSSIYRICRAVTEQEQQAVRSVLESFFELTDQGYINRRVATEIIKQKQYAERLSARGKKGAAKRWNATSNATGNAQAMQEGMPKQCLTDSIPQPQPHITTAAGNEAEFREVFEDKADDLKRIFPNANFGAEKELCINHYKDRPKELDPYKVILKWFNRIIENKPISGANAKNVTRPMLNKAQSIEAANLEASRRVLERMNHEGIAETY